MTKQEIIKKSWGDLWEKLHEEGQKEAYNNNGWTAPYLWSGKTVSESKKNYNSDINASSIDLDYQGVPAYLLRPKSLRGLETNNGWTKIESEDDLPKYNSGGKFKCFTELGNEVDLNGGNAVRNAYKFSDVTHYRLMKEDAKPIY